MKLPDPISIKDVADSIGAKLMGNDQVVITGLNEIHKVGKGDLTFCDLEKYFDRSIKSSASAVILNKEVESLNGKALLICDDPFKAYEQLVKKYRSFKAQKRAINESSKIHPSVKLEPGAVVCEGVTIGEGSIIQANVYIGPYTYIGKNVHIKPNATIGSDAFYFKKYDAHFTKWTTGGRVVIHDDVFIGAGCTIDSGVSGDTVLGQGTKLDSLIHIGHGAIVGKNCLMAAQVGIGGKTIIGDHVTLYGQVGIAQNLVIANNVTVLAKSGVSKNLEEGKTYFGTPAAKISEKYRELAILKRLGKEGKE